MSATATLKPVPLGERRLAVRLRRVFAAGHPALPLMLRPEGASFSTGVEGWLRETPHVALDVPARDFTGSGVSEAVGVAVEELGLKTVVLLFHPGDVEREDSSARPLRAVDSRGAAPDPTRDMVERMFEARGRLADTRELAAKTVQQLRRQVAMQAGPRRDDVAIEALVYVPQSGAMLRYDATRQDFCPLGAQVG